MKLAHKIHKAAQQSKIFRYKTYKKVGWVGYRQQADRIIKSLMIFLLVIGAFFIIRPDSESVQPIDSLNCAPNCPVEPYINTDAREVVHGDLGDAPVVAEGITETEEVIDAEDDVETESEEEVGPTLIQLEQAVQNNQANLETYTINKGETFYSFLSRAKIAKENHKEIIKTLETLINMRSIKQGSTIMVFTGLKGEFLGLSLSVRDDEFSAVLKDANGAYIPFSQEGRIETEYERITGEIVRTFSGSVQKYGGTKAIVQQITNALGNEINFGGLKAGDKFDIIYSRQVTQSGMELDTPKQVYFVGLETGQKNIYRYLYTDRSGTPAFYNPTGQREQKTIEKRPLRAVARLSSPYGWRTHPILMYRVFHSGVDLACRRGTPIIAAADGTITQIGRKGAYGLYIKIQHAGGFQTAYGHMNGFKKGLKKGSRVKHGDVIGYVGATGRATGPHVHYEVWQGKKTVNPFKNHVISGKQLSGFELEQFQSFAESIHPDFHKHLFGKIPPVPPRKPEFKK